MTFSEDPNLTPRNIPGPLKSYLEALYPNQDCRLLNLKSFSINYIKCIANEDTYYVGIEHYFLICKVSNNTVTLLRACYSVNVTELTFKENEPHYL